MKDDTVISGVDLLDVVSFAARKNKKFQALMLNSIEDIMRDHDEYLQVRKVVLDGMNNYTRSILRVFFGGVEDVIK